jgi:hypothetical protein
MVKKNNNFKFKSSMKKNEKKSPRKTKSSFLPYDETLLFKNEDNTDDLVRTFLRDTQGYRSNNNNNYYDEDYHSMW